MRTVGLVHQIRAGQRADPVGSTAVIGPADLLPEVLVDRPQADVAACGQIHVARSGDHGCIGRDVTACGQGDVLAADTGNLVDVGTAGHRIGGAHAGAVDVDVASGGQRDAVAAVDGAAQVVDVLRRRHRHVSATDAPTQVLYIVARQRNTLPPCNRAATVDDILRSLEGHIIAPDQRGLAARQRNKISVCSQHYLSPPSPKCPYGEDKNKCCYDDYPVDYFLIFGKLRVFAGAKIRSSHFFSLSFDFFGLSYI